MADIKLTEEEKAKLLGFSPFNADSYHEIEFKIKGLRPELCPTYHVRAMTAAEQSKTKTTDLKVKEIFELSRACIVGWSNVYDLPDGGLLEYSEDAKSRITDTILMEVYKRILKISGLELAENLGLKS